MQRNRDITFPMVSRTTTGNTHESCEFLQLPPKLIIEVLKNCDFHQCYKVRRTCQYLNNLIQENQKSLASADVDHIDLEKGSVKTWRTFSSRDQIPFKSIEYISKFFCFVNVKVLTVNTLDKELCDFLTENAKNKNLRFRQLRLRRSFSVSHESICQLLKAAKCKFINFQAMQSKLTTDHFEMEQLKNLEILSISGDDNIGKEFFDSILNVCNAKKFIFFNCERLSQMFVRDMLEKWLNGSRELETVHISTYQNFNFDEIMSGLNFQIVDQSKWSIKNVKGEKATITTMYLLYFCLFFEVNGHHFENTLVDVIISSL